MTFIELQSQIDLMFRQWAGNVVGSISCEQVKHQFHFMLNELVPVGTSFDVNAELNSSNDTINIRVHFPEQHKVMKFELYTAPVLDVAKQRREVAAELYVNKLLGG